MTALAERYLDSQTDHRLPPALRRLSGHQISSIVAFRRNDAATDDVEDVRLLVNGEPYMQPNFARFVAWHLDNRTGPDDDIQPAPISERADTIIKELTTLDQGWDGYEGLPAQDHAAQRAMEFLTAIEKYTQLMPDIVPLSNGGIQLEWFVGDYEVEVEIDPNPSNPIQIYFECSSDGRSVEIPVNDLGDVSGIASYFEELR